MISLFNILFLILRIDANPLSCQLAAYSISMISLSCNITSNFKTVSLIDNHGKDIAICELTSGNCSSNDFVQSVIGENEVKFYLHRNRTTSSNGNWFCSYEKTLFRPAVSSLKDKTASTIVNLFGKIVRDDDDKRLLLTCSSCRVPKGNHAEFLINKNSVDSVTYNNATGKCYHSYGQCSIGECNCSSAGNAFSRFFVLNKQLNTETYFSCDMRFHIEDQEQIAVFSKVATLSFNGKEFKDRGTRTVIIKLTDIHNRPKDKSSDTAKILIPVISASVFMVIVLVVALYFNLKERKCSKKKKKLTAASDEGNPLCEQIEEKNSDIGRLVFLRKDVFTESDPTHRGESTGDEDSFLSCISITTNMYNNSDPVSNIGIIIYDMKDQTVQVHPTDLTTPDTKDQTVQVDPKDLIAPEIPKQTDDEDLSQAPDDLSTNDRIEPEPMLNNDQKSWSIHSEDSAEDLETDDEDSYMSSNEDHPYLNIDIDERIYSKLTEDSKSQMKRKPYDGNQKLDVIFMNWDSFTKNWVYRVAVVLEEEFHLRCGISGYDNESFKYVTETSKIIIPFSRNSEKNPYQLELNEYIPLIVVVMIEKCSIPIQFPNMKCVDATKKLHAWFPKLLAALKVKS